MRVEDLNNEGTSQMYLACGRGAQGTIRALRQGLTVLEKAVSSVSGMGIPHSVMTLKGSRQDEHHKYIIMTFQDQSYILQISGSSVDQAKNTGFVTNEQTLHAEILDGDIFIQVTRKSLIQIQGRGENRKKTKWDSDKGRILKACSNSRQVIIYIEGGQIVYFEIDTLTGMLSENQTQFFETEICCLDIGHVPEGRQRCKFLVIGQQDKTVRVLSLEPESCL